jgi:CheY-like chemotaxis protein
MPANGSLDQVPILVVEDEPDMAREIAALLTSLGYRARIAETGAAGLEAARRDRAALLIVAAFGQTFAMGYVICLFRILAYPSCAPCPDFGLPARAVLARHLPGSADGLCCA